MTLIRAEELTPGQSIETQCCIVGSGPAGLTLAATLARAEIEVCVIESGYKVADESAQALNAMETIGHPIRSDFINRLRALGGTSGLWPGRCMALDPIDFEARDWIPDSGWPISYAEYSSYLSDAAESMGLPLRFSEKSSARTADPDALQKSSGFLESNLSRKVALWAKKPPRFWSIYAAELKKSPLCRVFSGLTVTGMRLNDAGNRVESLLAATTVSGRGHKIRAQSFVLAMGGIENARVLMLGQRQNPQARYPRWALGRFYMDHPRASFGRIKLYPGVDLGNFLGRPVKGGMVQVGLGLDETFQRDGHWVNGHCFLEVAQSASVARSFDTSVEAVKRFMHRGHAGRRFDLATLPRREELIYLLTPREILPNELYRAYHALRTRIRPYPRDLVVVNHCEQIPDSDSRITLSDTCDRFGNPLPVLDWRTHVQEVETLAQIHKLVDQWLQRNKFGYLESDPAHMQREMFSDASHHLGGTRISTDPGKGVVSSDLKVHGVHNLYVCGSSIFPTGGSANPTWSIVAFALRLGHHLARASLEPNLRGNCTQ